MGEENISNKEISEKKRIRKKIKEYWNNKIKKQRNWLELQREKAGLRSCGTRIFFRIFIGEKTLQTVSIGFLSVFGFLLFIYLTNIPIIEGLVGRQLSINEMTQIFRFCS